MYPLSTNLMDEKFFVGIWETQNFLNDQEIETIHQAVDTKKLEKGLTSSKYSSLEGDENNYRTSYVSSIYHDKNNLELSFIIKKIYNKIIEVNNEVFKYDLTDVEPLQYTCYNQNEYYNKHIDIINESIAGNLQRKLSFTIQLCDPEDYMGGNLKIYHSREPLLADKKKGTIIFFPSFLLHEVEKVTYGKRISLVGWVWGPRFK